MTRSLLAKSLSLPAWIVSSLHLITSEYSKLEVAIDDLGKSIDNTLDRQKQEFERTHKTEIENVKAEIENLIHEKQLLEDSLASNERTSQLETERDWYKKEALHLDEVLEQSKVQQKKLTDQLFEREQDAKLMKRQVEKLMKRSRILEMKLKELGVEVTTLSEDGIYVGAEIEEADDDVERKADDIPTK